MNNQQRTAAVSITNMNNLKLVSVRVDPTTLQKIDALASSTRYWKRNTIINGILTAVLDCANSCDIYDLVRYHRSLNKCITSIKIEKP